MQNEKQPYADWLEKIRNRAYDCTHPLVPLPRGMRPEKYDAIKEESKGSTRRFLRLICGLFGFSALRRRDRENL